MQKKIRLSYLWFSIFLLKFVRRSWRNPRTTIFIFVSVTVLLFTQLPKIHIVFSAEDLAGQGLPTADELQSIKDRYSDGLNSSFILSPPEGKIFFSAHELCQIRKWYSFQRNAIPELKSSLSTFDFIIPNRVDENKIAYRNILDLDCLNQQFRSPIADVQGVLNQSPFGFAQDHNSYLSLIFQFTFEDSTTSRFGSFDPKLVEQLRWSVQNELLPMVPQAQVYWAGPLDYQWYVLEGFKFSKYINLAMLIMMLLGLRFFYRTWKSGLFYISTLIITAVWVFGSKAMLGSDFDVMSTGLILIIGISSLQDFIFVSHEQMKGHSWKKSIRIMMVPSFFTSVTTMVGFLALCASDVEAVQRMGIWSSFGAFAEWILLFVILPCILSYFKNFKAWVKPYRPHETGFFKKILHKEFPRKVSYLSLVVYPLSIWAFFGINYNVAPHKVFPDEHEYSQSIEELKKTKGWIGVVSLIFDENTSTAEVEQIASTIARSETGKKYIAKYESPQNIQNWLTQVVNIDSDEARYTFNNSRLRDQFIDKHDIPRAKFYLNTTSVDPIQELKDMTFDICQGRCHLGGDIIAYSDFSILIPKTLMESLMSSMFIVAMIILWLAIGHNKISMVPSLLLSSFWGPLFMIMVLGFAHASMDFWKSIFASILVGLTGDNGIQYLFASKRKSIETGIHDRGQASITNSFLMATISLVYLGSYFSSPRYFGVILCSGLIVSLIGDLWLLTGLMPKTKLK